MNPNEIARVEEEADQPTEPLDFEEIRKLLEVQQACSGFEPPKPNPCTCQCPCCRVLG